MYNSFFFFVFFCFLHKRSRQNTNKYYTQAEDTYIGVLLEMCKRCDCCVSFDYSFYSNISVNREEETQNMYLRDLDKIFFGVTAHCNTQTERVNKVNMYAVFKVPADITDNKDCMDFNLSKLQ